MIKIRISYDRQQELEQISNKSIAQLAAGAKIKKSEEGQHKKIYITIKDGFHGKPNLSMKSTL